MTTSAERDEQERLTMQQRIDAFYRQSGGPNNPEIKKILEKHLLYGKDHGMPGYKETIEDAFIDTVVNDPSLLVMLQRFQSWRNGRNKAQVQGEPSKLAEQVRKLEGEVRTLRQEIRELTSQIRQTAAIREVES